MIPAEANRAITSGSISLNDRKLSDPRATLERTDLLDSHLAILRFGSKNHLVLHIDD
jgi:tyrosyl-tRNA synthetase